MLITENILAEFRRVNAGCRLSRCCVPFEGVELSVDARRRLKTMEVHIHVFDHTFFSIRQFVSFLGGEVGD